MPTVNSDDCSAVGDRALPPDSASSPRQLQHSVALAALAVLVVANLVGLWLAALLLWPELGGLTGPLTYGRWVPVHLDLQLFGWCSLPVIGLLLTRFLPAANGPAAPAAGHAATVARRGGAGAFRHHPLAWARIALAVWCGALAAGALAWLGGHTSGKIFLDWSGPADLAFTGAQLFLWAVLATGWRAQLRRHPAAATPAHCHPIVDIPVRGLGAKDCHPLVDNRADAPPNPPCHRLADIPVTVPGTGDCHPLVDNRASAHPVGHCHPLVDNTGSRRASRAGYPTGYPLRARPDFDPCNPSGSSRATWRVGVDALLLLFLLGVPVALHFAAQPDVYPPVNPQSGGATGHSLLASSLGIVGLALALPALLGRPVVQPGRMRGPTAGVLIGFAANWGAYMLVGHGNASHHAPGQIAALGTLLVWPTWLVWWYRKFSWAKAHRRWLLTAAAWASLLVLDGFGLFLPGVLERTKFTNALVAHSHIAMAGLLTSLNMLILISLAPVSTLATALARRGYWLAWNVACLAMVAVLTALGWSEGAAPRLIADGSALVTAGYLARLVAGAVMLAASVVWLKAAMLPNVGPDLHMTKP